MKTPSRKWKPPPWVLAPYGIIGCCVEKRFGQKWYLGKIVNVDIDEDTNDTLWKVDYDGDFEDYNRYELQKILCLDMLAIL